MARQWKTPYIVALSAACFCFTYTGGPSAQQVRSPAGVSGNRKTEYRHKAKGSQRSLRGKIVGIPPAKHGGKLFFTALSPTIIVDHFRASYKSVKIDEECRFSVQGLLAGEYLVGYTPPVKRHDTDGTGPGDNEPDQPLFWRRGLRPPMFLKEVHVQPGENLDFHIPVSSLEGRLINGSGAPAARAILHLHPSRSPSWHPLLMEMAAITGPDGAFRFEHIAEGDYTLVATATSWQGTSDRAVDKCVLGATSVQVSAGSEKEINWQCDEEELAYLGGTVRLGEGVDPDLMYVMVVSVDEPEWTLNRPTGIIPGGTGEWGFLLPQGRYHVFFFGPSGVTVESRAVSLETDSEVDVRLIRAGKIDVRLEGAPKAISGRSVHLRDQKGDKVIRLQDPLARYNPWLKTVVVLPTSQEGRTTIYGVRPGRYTVMVEREQAQKPVSVRPGETTTVRIEVSRERK